MVCLRDRANYAETSNICHFVGVWAPDRLPNGAVLLQAEMVMRAVFLL